ncbi:Hypothetical predicted protein [Marmota monax]|uniref:Uncharacterized protein n=1 Tax=Marmota monax TaxID=9995 RepID=A0A5E4BVY3_MARMO|nr:Hypothetical predicted protein [Marmota monax]
MAVHGSRLLLQLLTPFPLSGGSSGEGSRSWSYHCPPHAATAWACLSCALELPASPTALTPDLNPPPLAEHGTSLFTEALSTRGASDSGDRTCRVFLKHSRTASGGDTSRGLEVPGPEGRRTVQNDISLGRVRPPDVTDVLVPQVETTQRVRSELEDSGHQEDGVDVSLTLVSAPVTRVEVKEKFDGPTRLDRHAERVNSRCRVTESHECLTDRRRDAHADDQVRRRDNQCPSDTDTGKETLTKDAWDQTNTEDSGTIVEKRRLGHRSSPDSPPKVTPPWSSTRTRPAPTHRYTRDTPTKGGEPVVPPPVFREAQTAPLLVLRPTHGLLADRRPLRNPSHPGGPPSGPPSSRERSPGLSRQENENFLYCYDPHHMSLLVKTPVCRRHRRSVSCVNLWKSCHLKRSASPVRNSRVTEQTRPAPLKIVSQVSPPDVRKSVRGDPRTRVGGSTTNHCRRHGCPRVAPTTPSSTPGTPTDTAGGQDPPLLDHDDNGRAGPTTRSSVHVEGCRTDDGTQSRTPRFEKIFQFR